MKHFDFSSCATYLRYGSVLVDIRGCLPFVRIIRLGRALINGKGFSKITKPTERNGAYHLQFDFPSLFSADERLETGKFCKW